ncbi:UNVERIFIED_CONTAM: hypothetical protein Scaly_2547600 [Sesamum calycinum]|uniref:Uncharacterized protein n=1 Tax=Sesamum calycinum TaxID=2727403 RepID=A0AAW2J4A5_9LAMI
MCSNFWPCTDHPMDHGLNGHCLKGLCPRDRRPPTRYILRLWAAITIQEDTRNWKDKETDPVDCRATSPTTQERDSLKSQGRGWPRGPTWRLGISAGNAKGIPYPGNRGLSILRLRSTFRLCPSTAECFDLVRFMIASANLIPWALADVFHSSPGPDRQLQPSTKFNLQRQLHERRIARQLWTSMAIRLRFGNPELPELKRQLLVSPPGSEKSWFMEHRASSQREVKEKLNHKDRDCTDWADLLASSFPITSVRSGWHLLQVGRSFRHFQAYLLTAPGLLEDSSFLSPPSPSRSHDEPEHEAHSQSPVSQRRQERLTYHQQINCKLILRLRNGKEQKRGLLGVRHKKGHRSRLAGHLSRRSPQPDQLELDI